MSIGFWIAVLLVVCWAALPLSMILSIESFDKSLKDHDH